MSALALSNIALWFVVTVLSLLVFALMRQIGVLHERVFPAGALMTTVGPKVGDAVPAITARTLAGDEVVIGGTRNDSLNTLLLFVSPDCPICKTLLPFVHSVAKAESAATQVILASDGETPAERRAHQSLVEKNNLDSHKYVLSQTLGLTYAVEKLPFAAIIDKNGVLRAKGMVNSREHLESLFEAHTRGIASLQEFITNG